MNERFPHSNGHNELHVEPEAASAEGEANREQVPGLNPRIYVTRGLPLRAELTAGTWLDMARDPGAINAEMFAVLGNEETEIYDADRLYIWDYHDFGGFDITTGAIGLEGVDSIELLSQVARGIKEHGPAFAAWASAHEDDPTQFDRFASAYKGHYEGIDSYVRGQLAPLGLEDRLRAALPPGFDFAYIDYEAIGEQLQAREDIVVFPADGGGVWVFDEHA